MSVLNLIIEKISNLKGYHKEDDLSIEAEHHKLSLLLPELHKYNVHVCFMRKRKLKMFDF